MDTSESPLKVTPGQSFCVTPVTASPVTVSAGDITLCQIEPGTQGIFIAPAGVTEITLSAAANVQAVFKYAPALTQRGGNPTPSPEPVPEGGALKHGHIYALPVTEATDLSALTVEDDATAEIWLSYTAGSVTWPSAWVWGADTFIPASPVPAPDFVPLNFYSVQVSNFSGIGVTTVKVLSEIDNPQGGYVELTTADFVETSFDNTLTTIGIPNGELKPNRRTSYNSANKIVAFGFVFGETIPLFSGGVGYNYNVTKSVPPPSNSVSTSPVGEIHLTETQRRVELELSAYRGSTGSTLLGGDFDVVYTSDNWQTWDVLPFTLNEGVYSVRIDKKISKLALRSDTGGNYFVRLKALKLF